MPPALDWPWAKPLRATPSDLGTLTAYAAFLERYSDPEARTVYRQLLVQSNKTGDRGSTPPAPHAG